MLIPVSPLPNIVLLFQGLLGLFLDEGEEECRVGILRTVLEHNFLLEIRKFTRGGSDSVTEQYTKQELARNFSLLVDKTTKDSIEFHKPKPFNRKRPASNDRYDCRWLIDFEGPEVYDERVEIDRFGFSSIFRIKSHGLFFTAKFSDDDLIVIKGSQSEEIIGPIAIEVAAFIYLDKDDSQARFINGDESIPLPKEENVVHRISVSESRPDLPGTGNPNDSVFYSQAIVRGKISGKRIHFDSTDRGLSQQANQGNQGRPITTGSDFLDLILTKDVPRGDPMAVCLTAQLGRTKDPERESI